MAVTGNLPVIVHYPGHARYGTGTYMHRYTLDVRGNKMPGLPPVQAGSVKATSCMAYAGKGKWTDDHYREFPHHYRNHPGELHRHGESRTNYPAQPAYRPWYPDKLLLILIIPAPMTHSWPFPCFVTEVMLLRNEFGGQGTATSSVHCHANIACCVSIYLCVYYETWERLRERLAKRDAHRTALKRAIRSEGYCR